MRTSERRQRLKEALIAAAERVIAAHGLPHLKARDLAGEVGCALGAIYTVFPDLDGLVLEVNRRTLALLEAHLAGAREGPPTGEDGDAQEAAISDLTGLATAYLAFASAHPLRWRALFEHRMAGGAAPPEDYLREQARLFHAVEEPLGRLCPRLGLPERALLARTIFSATHGMVSLGLDAKLVSLPPATLREQIEQVVRATGRGLAAGPRRP